MFNNIALQAQWAEFSAYFLAGNPPLIVQLLVLNTVFLVYIITRRIRSKPMRGSGAINTMQLVLISTNLLLVVQSDLLALSWRRIVTAFFNA